MPKFRSVGEEDARTTRHPCRNSLKKMNGLDLNPSAPGQSLGAFLSFFLAFCFFSFLILCFYLCYAPNETYHNIFFYMYFYNFLMLLYFYAIIIIKSIKKIIILFLYH